MDNKEELLNSVLCSTAESSHEKDMLCFVKYAVACVDDEVYIDSELFMQVYENLVSNAVRYAESRITVSAGTSGDMLYVTVCDDGKGFSHEALKNASKPFFRGEQNPDMHFGLGLYI